MCKDELIARYRNLLVALARTHAGLITDIANLRTLAATEQNLGRRAGLNAKANALKKHSFITEALIRRNNSAMRQLFNTVDIPSVANAGFLYHNQPQPKTIR